MNGRDSYKYSQYFPQNQETRWATIDEIKNASSHIDLTADAYPAAGLPLISNGREAYVDDKDTHSLIFGATGSKKTRLFCMPLINILIGAGESFIATDPKGELYAKTSGFAKQKGYKTVVLNFRDLGKGDMWNPLSLPYELYHKGMQDEATALLNDFINTFVEPGGGENELFWLQTARSLALAHFLLMMEYAKPEEIHMGSFVPLCTNQIVNYIKDHLDMLNFTSLASTNYRSVLAGSEKTTDSIVVSLFAPSAIFTSQKKLCRMLSRNTFDIRKFGREKTAVYLIIPDEKTTLHFLATTFIKQAYEILIREAQKENDFRLPVRVNFVLDEFCNMPKIPDMPAMISAARSRNMRYYLVAQSKHQLVGKYGEDADTIKGNCDNWVFLTSKELDLLREISELCGSLRTPDGKERRLISVSELQRLDKEKGEALIMHAREYPIITEMADIGDYGMFGRDEPLPMAAIPEVDAPQFNANYFFDIYRYLEDNLGKKIFDFSREEFTRLFFRKIRRKRTLSPYEKEILDYMNNSAQVIEAIENLTREDVYFPDENFEDEDSAYEEFADEDFEDTASDDEGEEMPTQAELEARFDALFEMLTSEDEDEDEET